MGSNGGLPPFTPSIIKNTQDAIGFFQKFHQQTILRGIGWWFQIALDEYPSVESRAAAEQALVRAERIDEIMEDNLSTILAPATPQGGIRLDMNAADESTPAPADLPRAATTTPSTGSIKTSQLPHGTFGLKAIEAWAQAVATTALGNRAAILDTASFEKRPGTASIKVIRNIFAPRNTQASSAARTALDTIIGSFAKGCDLLAFVTSALDAAFVCRYYRGRPSIGTVTSSTRLSTGSTRSTAPNMRSRCP